MLTRSKPKIHTNKAMVMLRSMVDGAALHSYKFDHKLVGLCLTLIGKVAI